MESNEKKKQQLLQVRNEAAASYYEGHPIMTDDAFDALTQELDKLGVKHEVGHGYTVSSDNKIRHLSTMGSLRKVHDVVDIQVFLRNNHGADCVCQPKFDGLSLSLVYRNGVLASAATRGNGTLGENVMPSVEFLVKIGGIPGKIQSSSDVTDVRGEVLIPRSSRSSVEKLGYSVLRNAAAGILRRSTPEKGITDLLTFVAYDCTDPTYLSINEDFVNTPRNLKSELFVDDKSYLKTTIDFFDRKREDFEFETDGVVVKVADVDLRAKQGYDGAYPRWGIAYKFENVVKNTSVRDVVWQVGKTGEYIPVAVFDEVVFEGTKVSRASLHNFGNFTELQLRVGDVIEVTRANEVIPFVVGVARRGKGQPLTAPTVSEDGRRLQVSENGVHLFGKRDVVRNITASLKALDVKGVSTASVQKAIEKFGIEDVLDLLELDVTDWLNVPGFKEVSAHKAYKATQAARKASLAQWLAAVNIPNISKQTAKVLVKYFGSFNGVASASLQQLTQVPEIGEITAETLVKYRDVLKDWAKRMQQLGVSPTIASAPTGSSRFTGKQIVITGGLPTLGRKDAERLIEAAGGTLVNSVSKKTSLVVVGDNPGSKFKKAQKLGIPTVSAEEFEKLIL